MFWAIHFIIYINDLSNCVDSVCRIFADATKFYRPIYSEDHQYLLQLAFLNLCHWGDECRLEFSVPNCKAMQIGNVKHKFIYQMWVNEDKLFDLLFVTNEKDLGIIFLNNLMFNMYILNTVNKTNKLIGKI